MGVPGNSEMVAFGDAGDNSNCTHRKDITKQIRAKPWRHEMQCHQQETTHSATQTGQLINQAHVHIVQQSSAV